MARFSIDSERWLLLDEGEPLQSLTGWTRGQVAGLERLLELQDLVAAEPFLAVAHQGALVSASSPEAARDLAARLAADPAVRGPVRVVEISRFTRTRLLEEVPCAAP